jgi:c-di-GMP-binding flagellar brake protein YcgR
MSDELGEFEHRIHPRREFDCHARLAVGDRASLDARTVDISLGGICLMVPEAVPFGQFGVVKFEVEIGGELRAFSAVVRAVYGIPRAGDGYKIGFQFAQLDPANAALIQALVG